jgi:hypothetical protein
MEDSRKHENKEQVVHQCVAVVPEFLPFDNILSIQVKSPSWFCPIWGREALAPRQGDGNAREKHNIELRN